MKTLSPYQKRAYVESADDWKSKVLLNTAPIDKVRAEAAVLSARKLLKVTARPKFVWHKTPVECMAFIATSESKDITRKAYLTDALTPFFKWTESEITFNGIVRKLLRDVHTSLRFRNSDFLPFVYESTHVNAWRKVSNDPVKERELNFRGRTPDEIFKPEIGQFAWDIHRYHFARERLSLNLNAEVSEKVSVATEVARSCCLWWNHDDVVVMSERPTAIVLDELDRLHSLSGPALAYGDGFVKYMVHGIEVEPSIIKDPVDALTPRRIENEHNAEVRRTLLELYGSERYLRQTGARVIHEGRHGRKLWWRMPSENRVHRGMEADSIFTNSNEPLVMVEVKNSTPEPDGSIKTYFLRVAPHITNADVAVAWTFGLTLEEYEPFQET